MVALGELGGVAAVLVVIAFVVLLAYIVAGVVAILETFPVVGKYFAGTAEEIIHGVNAAAGRAVSGLFKLVGASWHLLARYADWLWREIESHANAIAAISVPLASLLLAYDGIRALVHRLTATGTHSDARLKALNRELGRLQRREEAIEDRQAKGIGADVQPKLNRLDREIDKIKNEQIPAIKAADAQASSAISNLYDWVKGKASLVGVGTFAFAVAAVIGQEAFSLLRCSEFGGLWNKWRCGLWNLLDGLLGLVISALALENVCTILPILETAFGEVVGPVTHLLTEVPLGGCETPPKSWAQLSVAAGPRPPAQTLGTLPT